MAFTSAQFEASFRLLMADVDQISTFTPTQVAEFRDQSIRNLYSRDLAYETTNWAGVYTDMPLAAIQATDVAIPANWRRITGVQYWTNETIPQYVADSRDWDDRVRAGYVVIYDGPAYFNQRIRLLGLQEFTSITDPNLQSEMYDVILFDSALRALANFSNKRASSRRSAAGIRGSDAYALRFIASYRAQFKQDLKEAVKRARTTLRPIG